jgi:hypothetical protein
MEQKAYAGVWLWFALALAGAAMFVFASGLEHTNPLANKRDQPRLSTPTSPSPSSRRELANR